MSDQPYLSGPDPLYVQLAHHLRAKIEDNTYPAGAQLPSEEELRAYAGISRSTVRKALALLESNGLITKVRGKGSFVTDPAQHVLTQSRFTSMTEHIQEMGKTLSTRVVDVQTLAADKDQAAFFSIPESTPLLEIKRLRYIDSVPFCVDRSWFTQAYSGLREMDLTGSLYELLEDRFNTIPSTGEKLFSIVKAGPNDQFLLNSSPDMPLMMIEDLVYDAEGRPLHITEQRLRSDKYKYAIKRDH